MTQYSETSSATVEIVARAICKAYGGDFDLINDEGKEAARGEARAAIRALRDNLSDEMRFAVWFSQYQTASANDEQAAILATKRFCDENQKEQDLKSFRAMLNAALGKSPGNMRAAFAGASR
ncbi:hypothetical protein ACT6QG_02335 [Xanthobacter sp. TB0136]|uniref:hypothetical protein n=1 Tax=Xanthobacter sp. TB0136 TaxID=3459177 RepID=UPI004039C276